MFFILAYATVLSVRWTLVQDGPQRNEHLNASLLVIGGAEHPVDVRLALTEAERRRARVKYPAPWGELCKKKPSHAP